MRTLGPCFLLMLLILAAVITLACGSSSPRTLQTVTIAPATAEGQAQYTATGIYTKAPSPVEPLAVTWGACYQNGATTDVTVSTSGLAQCGSNANGTYTVWGYATSAVGAVCNVETVCGMGCGRVTGLAQLTCP